MLNKKFRTNNFGAISQYLVMMLTKFRLQDAKFSNYSLDPSYGKNSSELLLNNDDCQSLLGSVLYISVNT